MESPIYRRTKDGRLALLREAVWLSPVQLQVLAVVNGYTSLLDIPGFNDRLDEVNQVAAELLEMGLVEPVIDLVQRPQALAGALAPA